VIKKGVEKREGESVMRSKTRGEEDDRRKKDSYCLEE